MLDLFFFLIFILEIYDFEWCFLIINFFGDDFKFGNFVVVVYDLVSIKFIVIDFSGWRDNILCIKVDLGVLWLMLGDLDYYIFY